MFRKYIWYCPELDVFTLQTITEGCHIAFEWDWYDMHYANKYIVKNDMRASHDDLMTMFLWVPMGEL